MNISEEKVKKDFEEKGYKTLRNGHPDFIFYKEEDGKIVEVKFVEVKRCEKDELSESQVKYRNFIKALGMDYELIAPDTDDEGMKERVTLCLDPEIIEKIDKERGNMSCSLFVNNILLKVLKLKGGNKKR